MDGILAGLAMLGSEAYWLSFLAAIAMAALAGLAYVWLGDGAGRS